MLTFFLAGVSVLLLQSPLLGAVLTPQDVAQEAEAALKSAMQAWAYEEYWRLWDMGSNASRAALSRQDFTERMRRGSTRPAAGKLVEAIEVVSNSPDSALITVTFGLEDKRRPWADTSGRPFLLRFEDGGWRVNLWDFVGLANYFPPDYYPGPPVYVPPSRRPTPRGPMY